MTEINPVFKQALLDTIAEIEANPDIPNPLVFKWSLEEKPNYTIALGFKKEDA